MHVNWRSLRQAYRKLPIFAPLYQMDPIKDPTIQKHWENASVFPYFHLISPICSIMHNEQVIIASSLAKVECAVLLALGSAAGIPSGRWTRKWSSFNTTQLSECLLSLKSSFFGFFPLLLPDEQRSNLTFWGADQTLLQPINCKFVQIFFLFFFGVYSRNRCANNSFSLHWIILRMYSLSYWPADILKGLKKLKKTLYKVEETLCSRRSVTLSCPRLTMSTPAAFDRRRYILSRSNWDIPPCVSDQLLMTGMWR